MVMLSFLNSFLVFSVKAQTVAPTPVEFINPTNLDSVQKITSSITDWILGLTIGIVILFLIIGGVYYITSAGDEKQAQEGKKIINYTLIGLVIILISYSLVKALDKIIYGP